MNKKTYWRKMINCHLKRLYKITWYETKSNFSQFFFSYDCCKSVFFSFFFFFFSFSKRSLCIKVEFCPKLIVSIVVLALVDHLKPKCPSSANHGGQHRVPRLHSSPRPLFQNIWIHSWIKACPDNVIKTS